MSGWNEAKIHAWLARRPVPVALDGSAGNDAAVLARFKGRAVWCTDQVVSGVHLEPDAPPRQLGVKGVARTISDLAASGASPIGVLLALACPRDWDDAKVRAVIDGASRRAGALGAEVLGGDLSSTDGPATLAVSALGELPGSRRPVGRDRARVGQALLLTGPLGGSRLGRHRDPSPRLAAGRALWEAGATAMMDVSDGLLLDLGRIARASGVALEVELERLPIHAAARRLSRKSGLSPRVHALTDGEDHELVATLPPAAARRLLAAGLPDCPHACLLGRVAAGSGVRLLDADGSPVEPPQRAGWLHGADRPSPDGPSPDGLLRKSAPGRGPSRR